jgi:8-amino-7-oxononanoate synthase
VAQVAASLEALRILEAEPERVSRLAANAIRFRDGVRDLGYATTATESPIVPILFSSELETFRVTRACRERGLFVVPITYPAVPLNSPRIRASVTADMTFEDIDKALQVLSEVKS